MSAVALDALIEGRLTEAHAIGYTKTTAKQAARALCSEGRLAEALLVLTSVMGHEGALREIAPAPAATVGDVLVTSWGYDQTNVDFYLVTAVSGSAVTIVQIGARRIGGTTYSDHMVAAPERVIGKPMRKRVQKGYRGKYSVKIESYAIAYPWDGEPCHATASGYGH